MASSSSTRRGLLRRPTNPLVSPLLTDFYQLTMAYAYWQQERHRKRAVFEVLFRKNPFGGEFTVFAGVEEVVRFVETFEFTASDVAYVKELLPRAEEGFFEWLRALDCRDVKIYGIKEGTVVFPVEPLLRIEGPLGVTQLLETTVLNLVNYASLVCTNAVRYRLAAPADTKLFEFGARRAQGPDGAISAARYTYIGGFDGTSNVLAGKLHDLPVSGTHSHAFVQSYSGLADLPSKTTVPLPQSGGGAGGEKTQQPGAPPSDTHSDDDAAVNAAAVNAAAVNNNNNNNTTTKKKKTTTGPPPTVPVTVVDLKESALGWRSRLGYDELRLNDGEFAAFLAFALAFPSSFVALVDTYSTLETGLQNFLCVALALHDAGYQPVGIRIDSGDLAYLSKQARATFREIAEAFPEKKECLSLLKIVASNDINESVLLSLREQDHAIDGFGVGTHLVTCHNQPALGCVYKLVEVDGRPTIKLSNDINKTTIPCAKQPFRLISGDGVMILDLLVPTAHAAPEVGERILCRHPFDHQKRAYVTPTKVIALHRLLFDGGEKNNVDEDDEPESSSSSSTTPPPAPGWSSSSENGSPRRRFPSPHGGERPARPSLLDIKNHVLKQLRLVRSDVLRPLNPTPYKISLTPELFSFFIDIWQENDPIRELA